MAEKIMFPGEQEVMPIEKTVLGVGNDVIEEAIEDMYGNEDLDELISVLGSQVQELEEIIVPVQFVDDDDNPLELEDGIVPEDTGIKFCMITDEEDNTWIPAFTNMEQVSELEGENVIGFPVAAILDAALEEDGCNGVVINPFGEKPLSLENELISVIMGAGMPMNIAFDMLRDGIEAYDKGDIGAAMRLYDEAARMIIDSIDE